MNAVFTYAIRYHIELECTSPMRSGGNDRDTEAILRRWDGTPMIQGPSLAGAMRSWFGTNTPDANWLFGWQQQIEDSGNAGKKRTIPHEGSISVSDLDFEKTASTVIRPRLKIDGATGTASDKAKFDVMHLETGTKGTFSIVWKGISSEDQKKAAQLLEQCFASMNVGDIRLGAQKSNGFGQIKLTSVKRRYYDMKNADDRTAWLGETDGTEIHLPEAVSSSIILRVSMETDALLVKSGTKKLADIPGVKENKRSSVAVSIQEAGHAVIPGSSIKGAVRAQIKRFAPFCKLSEDEIISLFGRESRDHDNGIAGKVSFSDGIFLEDPQKSTIQTRIRIDRLTGGVMDKAMVKEEVIGGSCEWNITLSPAVNQEKAGAILLLALRDLGIGLYSLGSGYAIGRGRPTKLVVRVASSVLTCENGTVEISDECGLFSKWMNALGGEPA